MFYQPFPPAKIDRIKIHKKGNDLLWASVMNYDTWTPVNAQHTCVGQIQNLYWNSILHRYFWGTSYYTVCYSIKFYKLLFNIENVRNEKNGNLL